MIFQPIMFAVPGLDQDLNHYLVIHYHGHASTRMYSKRACRKYVELIRESPELSEGICKEELIALEDAIRNSGLRESICVKDLLEARRGALTTLDEVFNSILAESDEAPTLH